MASSEVLLSLPLHMLSSQILRKPLSITPFVLVSLSALTGTALTDLDAGYKRGPWRKPGDGLKRRVSWKKTVSNKHKQGGQNN